MEGMHGVIEEETRVSVPSTENENNAVWKDDTSEFRVRKNTGGCESSHDDRRSRNRTMTSSISTLRSSCLSQNNPPPSSIATSSFRTSGRFSGTRCGLRSW